MRDAATICPCPLQVVSWRATQIIYPSDDLDLWPFDLGTDVQCHPWHGQPFAQFWCFCDFCLSSYGQTRVKMTTWRYNLDLWHLRSPHMSMMRVIVLHPCTKFEVRRFPGPTEDMTIFRLTVNWPLTFRPLNGVTGHACRELLSCRFSAC